VAGGEGAVAEDQQQVLGRAFQWSAVAVPPVEVGGSELDPGEVDAAMVQLRVIAPPS